MNFAVDTVTAADEAHRSYDPACFDSLAAIEERHFWFKARSRVISTLARQMTADLAPGYRVLEVGCGTGYVLGGLEKACPRGCVIGMDVHTEGFRHARRRSSCSLLQADVRTAPFTSAFDMIGVFDVLEHLPDDLTVLHQLHALLKPGGKLLVTVPAHPSMWSYFDEYSHHCRRYTLTDLKDKFRAVGYRTEYITEYMAAIFGLVFMGRKVARLSTSDKTSVQKLAAYDLKIVPVINDLLAWALSHEARWVARRRQIPFGASLVVIAAK
jgi:SAM-dependent methyltransferase